MECFLGRELRGLLIVMSTRYARLGVTHIVPFAFTAAVQQVHYAENRPMRFRMQGSVAQRSS